MLDTLHARRDRLPNRPRDIEKHGGKLVGIRLLSFGDDRGHSGEHHGSSTITTERVHNDAGLLVGGRLALKHKAEDVNHAGATKTESDRAGICLIPISNGFVEEIQQVSNGFAPEFGNTVGTVFNTITKSGSNGYRGEAAYTFRRTPFSARPKLLPSAAPTPEVNVDSFLADGGGRIVRDKLFAFG